METATLKDKLLGLLVKSFQEKEYRFVDPFFVDSAEEKDYIL